MQTVEIESKRHHQAYVHDQRINGLLLEVNQALAELVREVAELYRLFESKPAGTTLLGHETFNRWALAKERQHDHSHRSLHHLKNVGLALLPVIGAEAIDRFGITRDLILAEWVVQKGPSIPPEIIEMAEDRKVTCRKLQEEVDTRIWQGNPSHQSNGNGQAKWRVLRIAGPPECLQEIEKLIALGRRQLGNSPSDGEVVSTMLGGMSDAEILVACLDHVKKELHAEERHAIQQIAGGNGKGRLCPECDGEGFTDTNTLCGKCKGKGTVQLLHSA